jgi:hypothetical protein
MVFLEGYFVFLYFNIISSQKKMIRKKNREEDIKRQWFSNGDNFVHLPEPRRHLVLSKDNLGGSQLGNVLLVSSG